MTYDMRLHCIRRTLLAYVHLTSLHESMYAYNCGSDCPSFRACVDGFGKPGLQPASTPAVSSAGTRARGMEMESMESMESMEYGLA